MADNVLRWKGRTIHGWLAGAESGLARARYAAENGGYGPYLDRMCDEAITALRGVKRTNKAPQGQEGDDFRAGRKTGKAPAKRPGLVALAADVNRLVKG